MLTQYLALIVLAALLDVGRGNHEPPLPCEVLQPVTLPPDGSPSVFRREFNPGRFNTVNSDSPDITIRWVIEYSEKADFSNLPPLNINSELFDKTAFIYSGGQDIEEDMVISRGVVKGGRFVYTKLTPDDEFSFPRGETRVLENGVKYYFKNYKVRDGCISNDWVASGGGVRITERYPTEVLTRPPFLEAAGLPSAVRNLRHVAVELNRTAPYRPIIELNWTAPYDSGNNRSAHANGSMPVGYHVTAVPVPALSTGALRAGASVLKQSVTSEYVVMEVLQGQLYELRVVVNNSMGFSKEVPGDKILARAVSPPDQPRRVTFVINPLNMTNGTGNRNGSLSWLDPLDVGLGVACAADTLWTGCQAGYPLRIDRYSVQRIKDSGPEDMPLTPQPSNEIQIPVLYASAFYKFQVAAGNLQEAVVGSFSALGAYAESTTGVPLLSGPPLSMRLLYYPWSTNSSQGVGGQTEEAVIDAPQGRGVSDWCFVADGLQCPTDDSDVSVDWEPPANNTCQLCKNPELAVFVNSAYTFKVRAVKAIDIDFAEFYPEEIAFENNLAEALGPAWQSMATLTYSTFRCSGPGPDTHPSDVAACAEVNRTNIDDGRAQWDDWGYGWKEVLVTLTANTELAARGDATELCFTAMTPSNKRSKMCVDVRVIRPDPQFVEFTLEHNVTMGCRFMTDVTAEDRTELSLSRETALEKNYLVDITSSGGRKESRYRSTPFPWLPAGAQLNPKGQTSPTNNSITYRLQWTPKRFQEGFTYILNLEARGFLGDTRVPGVAGTPLRTISLQINVLRCRFCTETPDDISLATLASEWGASWLSIWSGNHVLVDADTVQETTVQLGPVLKVAATQACDRGTLGDLCNDDLPHIASRYGVSVQDLLWWNPDLQDEAGAKKDYQLFESQEICVLPNTCVNSGHIYSGGF